MSLRLKARILLLLDLGGRELKSSTVTTRHITASQNWLRINPKPIVTFQSKELMKGVIQNFWENLKEQIFLIFVIFHIRKVPYLLKPLLWTSASPYFNFVSFRQCKRHWDTLALLILVIMFNESCFFWWFTSGVFEPHFGGYSRCERRYPYIKGCNSGASQKILWKQVVTCSAHSEEHFKTSLAEYWRGAR